MAHKRRNSGIYVREPRGEPLLAGIIPSGVLIREVAATGGGLAGKKRLKKAPPVRLPALFRN